MKKAWESEYELMQNSIPVVLEEDEQGWLFSEQVETMDDVFLKMKWNSNVPGSGAPERVIIGAIQDVGNMGYDVTEAEKLIPLGEKYLAENDIVNLYGVTVKIWWLLENAPKIDNHPYWSYTVYENFEQYIKNVKVPKVEKIDKNSKDFLERTYYGWLAQIVAGALGTAVEGYVPKNILKKFGQVTDYVRKPNTYNDDITYEVAFLKAIDKCGKDVTSFDIAEQWVGLVPFGWSAEEKALANIRLGIMPPHSGKLNNPYREWIGAQMRGAVCGMIGAGDIRETIRLAYMDGEVSHHNNGIIGEIFNAVMVSLAYTNENVEDIVKQAIDLTPTDSEFYSVVKFAWDMCKKYDSWEPAWEECMEKYKIYNWIHAYPNAAAEVVALYFGEGDFDKTMNIICNAGFDVDCNAAQIATVIGIIDKEKTLAKKWTEPIGDELNTYIRANKKMSIKNLAEETVRLSKLF